MTDKQDFEKIIDGITPRFSVLAGLLARACSELRAAGATVADVVLAVGLNNLALLQAAESSSAEEAPYIAGALRYFNEHHEEAVIYTDKIIKQKKGMQ